MKSYATTFCLVLLTAACGASATHPSPTTTVPTTSVATGAGTFVPASAIDESPIQNPSFSPPYSDSLPADTVITIGAASFVALRTTAGHLRSKRGAIYLFPSSADYQVYKAALYGGNLSSFPTKRQTHWDSSNIGVSADTALSEDAASVGAMAEGIDRFNRLLIQVRSAVRVAAAPSGTMRFRTNNGPTFLACGANSPDGPRTQCTYTFGTIAEARRSEMWLRGLYLSIGPLGYTNTGLSGFQGYEAYTELSFGDVALLRTKFNRCHGSRLVAQALEAEDDLATCFIP